MAVTVATLKKMLGDYPDEWLVYCLGEEVGMTFPKICEAGPLEGLSEEEAKEAKLDRFVLILPED